MKKHLTIIDGLFTVTTVEGEKGMKPQPAVSGCHESTPVQDFRGTHKDDEDDD